MRAQLGAAHVTHAQRGKGEQPDLDGIGAADGQPQPPQLTQGRHIGPAQAAANRVGVIGLVPADMPRQ
ncbi:hypothetical protein D3C85_1284410 [compost metagenome]